MLEVKLSLPEGQKAPEWVQDLLDSGYLTEVRHLHDVLRHFWAGVLCLGGTEQMIVWLSLSGRA